MAKTERLAKLVWQRERQFCLMYHTWTCVWKSTCCRSDARHRGRALHSRRDHGVRFALKPTPSQFCISSLDQRTKQEETLCSANCSGNWACCCSCDCVRDRRLVPSSLHHGMILLNVPRMTGSVVHGEIVWILHLAIAMSCQMRFSKKKVILLNVPHVANCLEINMLQAWQQTPWTPLTFKVWSWIVICFKTHSWPMQHFTLGPENQTKQNILPCTLLWTWCRCDSDWKCQMLCFDHMTWTLWQIAKLWTGPIQGDPVNIWDWRSAQLLDIAAMDLAGLNAASAKIGIFPVRVLQPSVEKYDFLKAGVKMEGQYFRCLLLGRSQTSYCVATWRRRRSF